MFRCSLGVGIVRRTLIDRYGGYTPPVNRASLRTAGPMDSIKHYGFDGNCSRKQGGGMDSRK